MTRLRGAFTAWTILMSVGTANADQAVFEDFRGSPETRWEYIADGVMGGVSQGQADFAADGERRFVRLTGNVSTENNGGFIQVRRLFPDAFPDGTAGVDVEARGNGETYYLFVRTKEMARPWYYYSAAITPGEGWARLRIPLAAFERSHAHLNAEIVPADVVSLGIVAYGRDHSADISVSMLSFY